ncbi:MAG: DnaJ domain-containing protein [Desulfobacteraceae bacterium]|nr:DnaJ domain-containing protein [Desulfobacterales bacterium]MBL6967620.1 DnaJ domain-containing protein [Desulfobacteraceae bacterium]MBL7101575.1 DnaJ domain-containing protein [Desulfobacteraceae bacterium]MBL7171866.1 DnaJ domain-containing protein [Desulfobacteraceae bacterium]
MKILLSLLGLSYIVSPYDLFPDFFIGVGWIDDLIVLGLLWWYLYVYRKRRYSYEGHGPERGAYSRGEGKERTVESEASPRKDPYSVLGLPRDASSREIKGAYRRLANQYHPDKVQHLGEEFRHLAEIRFKEIQTAYQELRPK